MINARYPGSASHSNCFPPNNDVFWLNLFPYVPVWSKKMFIKSHPCNTVSLVFFFILCVCVKGSRPVPQTFLDNISGPLLRSWITFSFYLGHFSPCWTHFTPAMSLQKPCVVRLIKNILILLTSNVWRDFSQVTAQELETVYLALSSFLTSCPWGNERSGSQLVSRPKTNKKRGFQIES